jgi:S1-C subfamily serine protease
VAEDFPDFDNERDPSAAGPPLPPEDRLWRHPSEVSAAAGSLGDWGMRRRSPYPGAHRASALSAGFVGAMLAAGLVLVASHFTASTADPTTATHSARSPDAASTDASVSSGPRGSVISPALRQIVDRIGAATVTIEAVGARGTVNGSGLIIDANGVVLTSATLVAESSSLNVSLADGSSEMATYVGSDAATGIAVLRLPQDGLPTLSAPAALNRLVLHGMVALVYNTNTDTNVSFSSVRALDAAYQSPSGATLMDEIATDGIPGSNNLGSAVIDGSGTVIGVVVASDGAESLATPMWLAVSVANEIATKGTVEPGWLGINGIDDDASGVPDGVRVLGVTSQSAAQAAGVQPGDVIEAINGASVATVGMLQAHLYSLQPGATVRLTVKRGKRERTENAVLDVVPAA